MGCGLPGTADGDAAAGAVEAAGAGDGDDAVARSCAKALVASAAIAAMKNL